MPTYEFTAPAEALIRARGITHRLITPVADGSDPSIVRPRNWHEGHQIIGGTGGLESGTSFPLVPATGDLFYRTDRIILYFWDGTRWLSTTLYTAAFSIQRAVDPLSATNYANCVVPPTYKLWVIDFWADTWVNTTNSGTQYWTIATFSPLVTLSTINNAPNAWIRESASVNQVHDPGSAGVLQTTITKVSTAGTLHSASGFSYRLIG